MTTETLQARLRAARRDAGLTQAELARRAGISQPTLSELESVPGTNSVHIPAIANQLGVSALWLSTGRGPRYIEGGPSNPGEAEILELWRALPPSLKKVVLAQVRAIVSGD